MTLVTDIQYFPPLIFFKELSRFSYCILDQYDRYQKMTFRNRCTVSGSNGPVHLSIPLAGGREQKRWMKDVRIDNGGNWQTRHWKTIESCYNRSPFLDHYRDELRLMFGKKYEFLTDWNMEGISWICDKMAISTQLKLSKAPVAINLKDGQVDHRRILKPSTIHTLNPVSETYPQVFEDRFGFIPNLSILDRLFCAGNKF